MHIWFFPPFKSLWNPKKKANFLNTQLGSHSHLLRVYCCSIVLFVVDPLLLYSSLHLMVVLTISSLPLSAPTLKSHLTLLTLPFLSISMLTVYNFLSHYLTNQMSLSPSPYDLKQTKFFSSSKCSHSAQQQK